MGSRAADVRGAPLTMRGGVGVDVVQGVARGARGSHGGGKKYSPLPPNVGGVARGTHGEPRLTRRISAQRTKRMAMMAIMYGQPGVGRAASRLDMCSACETTDVVKAVCTRIVPVLVGQQEGGWSGAAGAARRCDDATGGASSFAVPAVADRCDLDCLDYLLEVTHASSAIV